MKKRLVLTVGNELMGDDGAGALLAQMIRNAPIVGWEVLEGGSAPENYLYRIREVAPGQVLIIDAADMDLQPGEIRLIQAGKIVEPLLMTTHALPLTFLLESLQEFVPKVDLIGIQPDVVAFGYPISHNVQQAVQQVYDQLKMDEWVWEYL